MKKRMNFSLSEGARDTLARVSASHRMSGVAVVEWGLDLVRKELGSDVRTETPQAALQELADQGQEIDAQVSGVQTAGPKIKPSKKGDSPKLTRDLTSAEKMDRFSRGMMKK